MSAIVRLLLLFHLTEIHHGTKGDQNVSFDRSTPGPGWRSQEVFLSFFGCYTMRTFFVNIKQITVKWNDSLRSCWKQRRIPSKCLFIGVMKWRRHKVCTISSCSRFVRLPPTHSDQVPEKASSMVIKNLFVSAKVSNFTHWLAARWERIDWFMERTLPVWCRSL